MSAVARIVPWLLFAAALVVAPQLFRSGTSLTMLSIMGLSIVFALSYNMLLGQTGLLSFGHAVYYGLGGFMAIHAMNVVVRNKYAIPLPVIPLVGGLSGLVFAIIFGSVSTRRAGTVFSMISLGLGELVASSALILRTFFGGEEGVTANRARLAPFFGHKFGPQIEVYYLIAAWCFVCVVAMYALTRTPFGRMCNAVRENPERVQFVGYSPQFIRFVAFCFAGFFGGVAGGLAAINFEIMNTQSIGAAQSGLVLLMTFIGGIGTFVGPIIGAILISFLQIMLPDITGAWMLYFGLMFILVVMFAPGGIAGWIAMHGPLLRGGQIGRILPSYLLALVPLLLIVLSGVAIIELAHRALVSAQSEGADFTLFGLPVRSDSYVPWAAAVVCFAVGIIVLRAVWPKVSDAWGVALASIRTVEA